MWTGASDIQQIGKISEWNYMDHINESIYPGTCGELRGTAGEFFPPGQGKDYLEFFSGDLCRQAYSHCLKITQNVAFEYLNFGIFRQFLSYKN